MYINDPGEVLVFANDMYQALVRNDYKGGWQYPYLEQFVGHEEGKADRWLLKRLRQETTELRRAIDDKDYPRIISEAADVANFAMMLADRARRREGGAK